MSASAAWPGAEGPQSCCGGGGGGGELVNGNGGGEITKACAISEWESATCDPADATRSASTDSTVTREREDAAARGLSNCCRRRSAAPGGGEVPRGGNIDGEDGGGVRCSRCMGETRTAARRGHCETGGREFRNSAAAVSKRRGCSYSGASKRVCFSGTNTALHCGGSDPDSGTGSGGEAPVQNTAGRRQSREEAIKQRRRGDFSKGAVGAGGLTFTCEMKGAGGVTNGERRGCRMAKGRVRLYRVRSFLASTEGLCANGVPVAQLSDHGHGRCKPRPQLKPQYSGASSSPGARADGAESGTGSPAVNGGPCAGEAGQAAGSRLMRVEAAQVEAKKRQVQLGERTDTLWRRLHAVQVKQVERHVTQQLGDLRRAAVAPNSAELSRLARSCSEALRTAGGALDSDHTASSSGGGSDSEEEEEDEEEGGAGGRHVSPSGVKSV